MEKEDAVVFMNGIQDVNAALNNFMNTLMERQSNDETELLKAGTRSTSLHIFKELMLPIIRSYPELDPDKD